jgi:hydrophobe/amphiphile efflux-3 (HAE3) family protein
MPVRDGLERIARAAAGRPLAVLLAVTALALGGGLLALTLEPSTGADTLASRSSDAYEATDDLHRRFGDDAVAILVDERVADLVLTADLGRLIRLEGCLGGNVPRGARPYGGPDSPCAALARTRPVRVVYGPGTFLNESVRAVQEAVIAQLRRGATAADLQQLALQTGIQGIPQIDNRAFISQIVFDPERGADVPKARFASLFPSRDAALIQVRLDPDLSPAQRSQAIGQIRAATAMPMFRLEHGGGYTVSGVPVVTDALADSVTDGIAILLVGAVVAMALALLLLFRARLRLLPLAIALAAAGMTFGAMALAGAGLTMAALAVLPVLIGLAVDYAIQFQSRVEEQHASDPSLTPAEAVAGAARAGAPTIATAALATGVGFLVLLLSPIPMVRGFGLLLVVGIAIAFALTLTAGSAALALPARARAARAPRTLPPALADARDILKDVAKAALTVSVRRPARVLAVALALATAGWVVETQTHIASDVRELVPADMPALQDLDRLQDATASSGEIDVLVQGRDLARPEILAWMAGYQQRVLRRFGYDESRGCRTATLCPAFSLPDLLQGSDARSERTIDALLAAVPPYFAQGVLTPRRDAATLAFGIRLMDLEDQQRVIEAMREELDPPPGVEARLAGMPVVAAQANADLSSPWRRLGTIVAGLLAVASVLLAVFRCVRRALVPLVPIALATGWSALVLFATQVPLNPMSATLGALVIAISTEFAVLLSERFRQERAAGHRLEQALARTYRSTGRAVLASGVTAIAGFGVLALSDFRMLRDFGIVTVVDLTVSLVGVLLVLPSVLVLVERGAPRRVLARLSVRRRPSPPAGRALS